MMTLPLAIGLPQGGEWVILFLVVLLLFGAKKLPELARSLGKSLGEFKKAKEDLDREIRRGSEEAEKDSAAPRPASLPENSQTSTPAAPASEKRPV